MFNTPVQNGEGFFDGITHKYFGKAKYKGGMHAILQTKDGFKRANYMGPSTHVIDRLKAGDEGLGNSDTAAMAHDLRYSLSKNAADVRYADERMLNAIKNKPDYMFNKVAGYAPIRAKMWLEDRGIWSPNKFANYEGDAHEEPNDQDRKLMQTKESELTQRGFGKSPFQCSCHHSK
jgi:hypothetical protein